MDSLGKRLQRLRAARKLTQDDVAAAIGVTRAAVSHWERDQNIKPDHIEAIARFYRVSPHWLWTGEGNEKISADIPNLGDDSAKTIDVNLGPSMANVLEYQPDEFVPGQSEMNDRDAGAKSAESWGLPESWLYGEMRIRRGAAVIFLVQGVAMSPVLDPGDRVIVDTSSTNPTLESIYAVRDGDAVIVRYVQLVRGRAPMAIRCRCANPIFDQIELELGSDASVIGRVVGRVTRL
jgi:transcriptional regulator with XRE-family HTH domain